MVWPDVAHPVSINEVLSEHRQVPSLRLLRAVTAALSSGDGL